MKLKYLPNLTPIRFILALFVAIYHISQFSENRGFPFYNNLSVFHKGTEAVYVFFSLSGFLIIKQLFEEKKVNDTINFKAFYLKRALRIFPLYYLVLIFGFLYYHLILPSFGYQFENNYNLMTGIALSASFFPNIFSTYSPGGVLEILWSIGVEEQFYLLIVPLFLLLPLKRIKFFLGAFSIVFFLIYYSEFFDFFRRYNMLFFYFSFSGLCALISSKSSVHFILQKMRAAILLMFVLCFSTPLFKNNLSEIQYTAFSVLLFGVTIFVLAQKPIKILENRIMKYLGKISYGIYMYHAIVMQLVGFIYMKAVSKFNFQYSVDVLFINIAIVLITIAISHLSYKYFETYFLNLKPK